MSINIYIYICIFVACALLHARKFKCTVCSVCPALYNECASSPNTAAALTPSFAPRQQQQKQARKSQQAQQNNGST